jgi:hypothetical protein
LSIQPSPTSELAQRYPELATFSRAYLHQDWDLDFSTPEEVLLAFRSDYPESAAATADAMTALLEQFPDEAARYRALIGIGWSLSGPPGRLDEFLRWARGALRDSSGQGHSAAPS